MGAAEKVEPVFGDDPVRPGVLAAPGEFLEARDRKGECLRRRLLFARHDPRRYRAEFGRDVDPLADPGDVAVVVGRVGDVAVVDQQRLQGQAQSATAARNSLSQMRSRLATWKWQS